MTVAELIERLQGFDPRSTVIVDIDENDYPCAEREPRPEAEGRWVVL